MTLKLIKTNSNHLVKFNLKNITVKGLNPGESICGLSDRPGL